ncbi:hypothetical protein JCM6882_001276 [Rhodosporidiobolus microsporus]
MLGKRSRPSSSSSSPHTDLDAPLTPPKRPLTAHLGSTKAALTSPTNNGAKRNASDAMSSEMSRMGSQKENFAVAVVEPPAVVEEQEAVKMDGIELGKEPAAFTSPPHDPLFDVPSPSLPSTVPADPSTARAIPHIYAHASLLLSASSDLSSSLPLEGRADQRDTLLAFLSRRFPAAYAPLDGASSSSSSSTPSRPGPASMYISGPPGIGKTALLLSVLADFNAQVQERELGEEVCVAMENCAAIGGAGAEGAWDRLGRGLGMRVEKESGGRKLKGKERFEEGLRDGRKYLLILDEIDHLVSPTSSSSRSASSSSSSAPDLLNALFALSSTPASPLTLIGIANDLTLKALSLTPAGSPVTTPTKGGAKGKAKVDPLHTPTKPVRLHFKPYAWQELVAIVAQRLALLAPSYPHLPSALDSLTPASPSINPPATKGKPSYPLIAPPALERLCKKVASTTGDVRTVLSLARSTIASSLPPSLSPAELRALTPATAPKAGMPHLTKALAASAAAAGSGAAGAGGALAPGPTLKARLAALQSGPHHRLVLCACVVALSRSLSNGDKQAGLDASAAEAQGARVTIDDAFRAYRDVVLAASEALRATKSAALDAATFGETVGMVEDLCGAVVVRGRPGAGKATTPTKRTPTKRSERGKVTVELSPTAALPDLVAALTASAASPAGEDEPTRLARRVLEKERADQRWRVKRWEMGRDEERRAGEEEEGREWERRVRAAEEEGGAGGA